MKVYISADIEGITGITHWDEASKNKSDYRTFQEQMTDEVVAACEGALNAGATEIFVKDAHGTGRNIIISRLPEEAKIIRGWSGHPFNMVQELDETFYAALFIGYHSRAGSDANPLAHSLKSSSIDYININGIFASEFLLHTYAAALVDVPIVFVSGDEGLCWDVSALNERIQTLSVNSGIGNSTISIHPKLAIKKIKEGVETALRGNVVLCKISLPERFTMEIRYKSHSKAYQASYYPGATRAGSHSITFETIDYFEILRMLLFVC
jgi:D-amino peptidase